MRKFVRCVAVVCAMVMSMLGAASAAGAAAPPIVVGSCVPSVVGARSDGAAPIEFPATPVGTVASAELELEWNGPANADVVAALAGPDDRYSGLLAGSPGTALHAIFADGSAKPAADLAPDGEVLRGRAAPLEPLAAMAGADAAGPWSVIALNTNEEGTLDITSCTLTLTLAQTTLTTASEVEQALPPPGEPPASTLRHTPLPRTGSETAALVGLAALLVSGGVVILVGARRRRAGAVVVVVALVAAALSASPRPVEAQAAPSPPEAPSGKIVYTAVGPPDQSGSATSEIWVAERDGSRRRQLTSGYHDQQPEWSPNGRTIAFTRHYNDPGSGIDSRIMVMGLEGTPSPITFDPDPEVDNYHEQMYAWSPDGTGVMFHLSHSYKTKPGSVSRALVTGGAVPAPQPLVLPAPSLPRACRSDLPAQEPAITAVVAHPDPGDGRMAFTFGALCDLENGAYTVHWDTYVGRYQTAEATPVDVVYPKLIVSRPWNPPPPNEFRASDWSPDGSELLSGYWAVPAVGGQARPLAPYMAYHAAWVPDQGCWVGTTPVGGGAGGLGREGSWAPDGGLIADEMFAFPLGAYPRDFRVPPGPQCSNTVADAAEGIYRIDPSGNASPELLIRGGRQPDVQCMPGSCLTILELIAEGGDLARTYTFSGAVNGSTTPRDPFGQGGVVSGRVQPGPVTVKGSGGPVESIVCDRPAVTSTATGMATLTVAEGDIATCTYTFGTTEAPPSCEDDPGFPGCNPDPDEPRGPDCESYQLDVAGEIGGLDYFEFYTHGTACPVGFPKRLSVGTDGSVVLPPATVGILSTVLEFKYEPSASGVDYSLFGAVAKATGTFDICGIPLPPGLGKLTGTALAKLLNLAGKFGAERLVAKAADYWITAYLSVVLFTARQIGLGSEAFEQAIKTVDRSLRALFYAGLDAGAEVADLNLCVPFWKVYVTSIANADGSGISSTVDDRGPPNPRVSFARNADPVRP